ncbi:MAG: LuxR family transcriptional regulator [Spirochaetales bacterium]|nr:MAG: LuxR family transcriptional regulator [Spirochaetales bacterium]
MALSLRLMLFIMIISFCLGLYVAFGLLNIYKKRKNKTTLFFFLFMLSFVFAIGLDSALKYLSVTGSVPVKGALFSILVFCNSFWASSFIVTLPLFSNSLFSMERRQFLNRLFLVLFAISVGGFAFINLTEAGAGSSASRYVPVFWGLSMAGSLLYCLLLFIGRFKHVQIKEVKDFIRAVAVTVVVFLPVFVLKEFFDNELSAKLIAKPYLIRPMLYLTINILSVIHFVKYLKRISRYSFKDMPSDGFIRAYDLSEGETDVLWRLVQGKSYQQIGQELFISLIAVKEHVANIMKKTGVRSKSGLNNLLKTHCNKFLVFEGKSDVI